MPKRDEHAESQKPYRQGLCRAPNCGEIFFVCPECERGQVYCSDACRQYARRLQHRAANRRHQQSTEGRLDHRDRQRAYRLRRLRVTDHSYVKAKAYGKMGSPVSPYLSKPLSSKRTQPSVPKSTQWKGLVCKFCGRGGRFLNPFIGLKGTKL